MPKVVSIGDVPSEQADAMLLAVSLACYSRKVPDDMQSAMLDAYDLLESAVLGYKPESQGYLFSDFSRSKDLLR